MERLRAVIPISRVRRIAPFVALIVVALAAIVLSARAGLSFCDNRVTLPMPGMANMPDMAAMPGMAMDQPGIMICPVVLVLIVASVLVAAATIALAWSDPDRALTRRAFTRALARLPVVPSAGVLALFAGLTFVVMSAVDGSGIPDVATCAQLAGLLIGGAATAVGLSCLIARLAVAFGQRLVVAIAGAIAARVAAERPVARHEQPRLIIGETIRLYAAGRGFRAPPAFVR